MRGLGNNNQIVYVEVHKQSPSRDILYLKEKRNFLGNIKRKEGFYKFGTIHIGDLGVHQSITFVDIIPSNIFINGNIALEKSHIIIEYSNGRRENMYFNSDEEMIVYVKREFQGREWREFK